MKDFHDLTVWQKAHQLTLAIYEVTRPFPSDERYGLTTQLRRAAASIPANIAEGCGRQGDAELGRFCSIAMGSASELEYHLLLAKDLNLLHPATHADLDTRTTEVKRMLAALIQKLRAANPKRELKAESQQLHAILHRCASPKPFSPKIVLAFDVL